MKWLSFFSAMIIVSIGHCQSQEIKNNDYERFFKKYSELKVQDLEDRVNRRIEEQRVYLGQLKNISAKPFDLFPALLTLGTLMGNVGIASLSHQAWAKIFQMDLTENLRIKVLLSDHLKSADVKWNELGKSVFLEQTKNFDDIDSAYRKKIVDRFKEMGIAKKIEECLYLSSYEKGMSYNGQVDNIKRRIRSVLPLLRGIIISDLMNDHLHELVSNKYQTDMNLFVTLNHRNQKVKNVMDKLKGVLDEMTHPLKQKSWIYTLRDGQEHRANGGKLTVHLSFTVITVAVGAFWYNYQINQAEKNQREKTVLSLDFYPGAMKEKLSRLATVQEKKKMMIDHLYLWKVYQEFIRKDFEKYIEERNKIFF